MQWLQFLGSMGEGRILNATKERVGYAFHLYCLLLLLLLQPSEVERGAIKGAINYPLSSLREKLPELPKDKKLYVYCQVRLSCTATGLVNRLGALVWEYW